MGNSSPTFFQNQVLPDGPDLLFNYSLTASVATNALTISLKDKSGNNPSPGNPVLLPFRSGTLTTGTYQTGTVSDALCTITIPSGTGLGLTTGVTSILYVYGLLTGSSVELIASPSGYWNEGTVQTTVAVSGGSSLDSLYSTTQRTNVPIVRLGYVLINLAATNLWSNSPTEISSRPFTPTRQIVVGTPVTSDGATSSATFATPTNPVTVTITPQRTKRYRISAVVPVQNSGANNQTSTQIAATSGSPTVIFSQTCFSQDAATLNKIHAPYTIVGLVAGSAYTFTLQMKVNAGTGTITSSAPANGNALVAEEL